MKHLALIAAAAVGAATLTAAPASAYSQVCVATPETLIHTAYAEGDGNDDSWLGGLIVRPLPNSAVGCAAYDGTPLQEWETLYPGERTYYDSPATYAPAPATWYDTPAYDQPTTSEAVSAPVKAKKCKRGHRHHRHCRKG